MTAPDAAVDRVLDAAEAVGQAARVRLGAADTSDAFPEELAALSQDERDLFEGAFIEGARLAVALLVERGHLSVFDLVTWAK